MHELWIILALIAINGVLSGAEIAVVSVRSARIHALVEEGSSAAKALERLRKNPERFLATVQIGITVVGAAAAAFGGSSVSRQLAEWLRDLPLVGGEHAEDVAFTLVVAGISYLSLVLGELVPKSLALRSSERYALLMSRPLLGLAYVATPMVWLLTKSSNVVLFPFRDSTNFMEARVSLEEVRHMVQEAAREGSVDRAAGEIVHRAIDFGALTAVDVMVHRRYVVSLPVDASMERVKTAFVESAHQRIPVHDANVDHIVGYVSWRDVLERVVRGGEWKLGELLRPCRFVPETVPALNLLREMQMHRAQMAIVVDEHGGTAGLVTLEDLVEELVGDIVGEHEKGQAENIRRESPDAIVVQGTVAVRDVNRFLGSDVLGEDDATTIGGFCVTLAEGRIPAAGELFTTESGAVLEVVESSARRVRSVRVRVEQTANADVSATN